MSGFNKLSLDLGTAFPKLEFDIVSHFVKLIAAFLRINYEECGLWISWGPWGDWPNRPVVRG